MTHPLSSKLYAMAAEFPERDLELLVKAASEIEALTARLEKWERIAKVQDSATGVNTVSEFDVEHARRTATGARDWRVLEACDEIERLRARIELLEKMIATEDWIHEVAANAARKALEDEAE